MSARVKLQLLAGCLVLTALNAPGALRELRGSLREPGAAPLAQATAVAVEPGGGPAPGAQPSAPAALETRASLALALQMHASHPVGPLALDF